MTNYRIHQKITTANSTYKKLAVQWLSEALCFVGNSVLEDSSVPLCDILKKKRKKRNYEKNEFTSTIIDNYESFWTI